MFTEKFMPGAQSKASGVETAHAVLLQPPPGDLTGPYPALAYLKAYAERKGYKVLVRDLGIEALWYLTEESRLPKLFERADILRNELETKAGLSPAELNHYAQLVSAVGLGLEPGLIRKSMAVLKNKAKFYQYLPYRRACLLLESFYRLLSAVCFPTRVTSSEYPTVRELGSFEAVAAHCGMSINPYVEYFENVLFPYIAATRPKVIGISMVFALQSVQALVLGRMLRSASRLFMSLWEEHTFLSGSFLCRTINCSIFLPLRIRSSVRKEKNRFPNCSNAWSMTDPWTVYLI